MPSIRISLLETTIETKKALAEKLTKVMVETAGVPAAAVTIYFDEYSKASIANAGKLFAEGMPQR